MNIREDKMITKAQFVSYITKLEELSNVEDCINEALKKLDTDFNFITFAQYTNLAIGILQDVFQDKKNDWIGYYIWEKNFGKDLKVGDVTAKNGKPIPLKTAEDLYSILIKNLKLGDKK